MKLSLKAGTTSKTIEIFIQDSSSTTGAGLTGLVYNSSGLSAYFHRPKDTSATAITLATLAANNSAYSSGGFREIDATNLPGWYRFDIPDTALAASNTSCSIMLKGATNMAPLPIEIELTAWDNQDAVRGGLTALPNANAEAAGGLYTRGTGAGQIKQSTNGQVDVNLEAIHNVASKASMLGSVIDDATATILANVVFINSLSVSDFLVVSSITLANIGDNKRYASLAALGTFKFVLSASLDVTNSHFKDYLFDDPIAGSPGSYILTLSKCVFEKCVFNIPQNLSNAWNLFKFSTIRDSKILSWMTFAPASEGNSVVRNTFFGASSRVASQGYSGAHTIDIDSCFGFLDIRTTTTGTVTVKINDFNGSIVIDSSCTNTTVNINGGSGTITNNNASATVTYNGVTIPNGTTLNIPAKVNDIAALNNLSSSDVQSAMTTQGYTTTRAGYLDTLNGLVAAIWNALTSGMTTVGSIGKWLKELVNLSSADVQSASAAALAAYNTTGVAKEASVLGIQNNTSFVASIAEYYLIPSSSYTMYKIRVCLYDTDGNMEDPDSQDFGLQLNDASGTSKSGLLYKEYAALNLLDSSGISGYKKLVREDVGIYYCFIKIASTETVEQLMYGFAIDENAIRKYFTRTNLVLEENPGVATLADNTTNADIVAKALKSRDVSGTTAVTGSIEKDILDSIEAVDADINGIMGTDGKALISTDSQDLSSSLHVDAKKLNGATPNNISSSDVTTAAGNALTAYDSNRGVAKEYVLEGIGTTVSSTYTLLGIVSGVIAGISTALTLLKNRLMNLLMMGNTFGGVFYVAKTGSDSNDGMSWVSPFLTIKAATDAISTFGGVIYIRGSWYLENVVIPDNTIVYGMYIDGAGAQNDSVVEIRGDGTTDPVLVVGRNSEVHNVRIGMKNHFSNAEYAIGLKNGAKLLDCHTGGLNSAIESVIKLLVDDAVHEHGGQEIKRCQISGSSWVVHGITGIMRNAFIEENDFMELTGDCIALTAHSVGVGTIRNNTFLKVLAGKYAINSPDSNRLIIVDNRWNGAGAFNTAPTAGIDHLLQNNEQWATEDMIEQLTPSKNIYADSTMPDDTGDGLTPETAKKTLAAATALFVSGEFGTLHISGAFNENVIVPDNVIMVSYNGVPIIGGAYVSQATPIVTLGTCSEIRSIRVVQSFNHAIDKTILMGDNSVVDGVSGYPSTGTAGTFIDTDDSYHVAIRNCFYGGNGKTDHAIIGNPNMITIENNHLNGFLDNFIELVGGVPKIISNYFFGVVTGKYVIHIQYGQAGAAVTLNLWQGDGDFILIDGSPTNCILANNEQWAKQVDMLFVRAMLENHQDIIEDPVGSGKFYLVTYDKTSPTVEICRQYLKNFDGTDIDDLAGTGEASRRGQSSV